MIENQNECELGYWVGKAYWNNGYVTEAATVLINHAFKDLHVSKIWAGYYEGNVRSEKVMNKLGFAYHHTTKGINVIPLNETREGHVYFLKEIKNNEQ